jgi:hypothetical protein
MADTGWLNATGTPIALALAGGDQHWTLESNRLAASDDNQNICGDPFLVAGNETHYLGTQNHGAAVPAGATIDGVEMQAVVGINASMDGNVHRVSLVKAGALAGTVKTTTSAITSGSKNLHSRGGATDLWGTTLTPAEVNSGQFGVAIACIATGGVNVRFGVDQVQIKIHYTPDTTPPGGTAISIAAGAAKTATRDVNVVTTTTDADKTGYEIKHWGDVDGAYDANVQPLEAGSAWVPYATATNRTIRLSTGDGVKTIRTKIRDQVANASAEINDTITLDQTAPQGVTLTLQAGVQYTEEQIVTANPETSDGVTTGYQQKIWGDVDPTYDGVVQATEGASAWFDYATYPTYAIKLSNGLGSKTIYTKIRDDMANESAQASATILRVSKGRKYGSLLGVSY